MTKNPPKPAGRNVYGAFRFQCSLNSNLVVSEDRVRRLRTRRINSMMDVSAMIRSGLAPTAAIFR